jgi:hypothetical protein
MTLVATFLAIALTQPPPNAPSEEDVVLLNSRSFLIPIRVVPERKDQIAELQLFVSRDRGHTWTRIATAKSDARDFVIKEQHDGLVWYALRVIDWKGAAEPESLSRTPAMKVLIQTDRK